MSTNERRRVVITGLGAVTPLGIGMQVTFERLLRGESGIDRIRRWDPSDLGVRIAGEVPEFRPQDYMPKREVRRHDRFSQLAVAAAKEALAHAQIELGSSENGRQRPVEYPADRIAVLIATGIGGLEEIERQHTRMLEKGPSKVSPFMVPKMMANAASGQVSIAFGLRGPNYCTVSACASGAHAIGEGLNMIRRGQADMVVVGGAEAAVTPLGVAAFHALRVLSQRNDEPTRASRPFDQDRDGFVMGEGAGVLVLEALESAQARDVPILAELTGYGASADAYHLTEPAHGGEGCVRAIAAALEDADVQPSDIQYVNAHGTSTKYNDRTETEALHSSFGDHARRLVISSTKSMIGHTLGAAGAIELAVTILMISCGRVHPTINYETPDSDCDLDYCPNKARDLDIDVALSSSLGFGGHNVALIVRKF